MSLSESDENDIWKRLRKGESKGARMDERIRALQKCHNEIKGDLKGIRRMILIGIITFIASAAASIAASVAAKIF